MPWRSLDGGEEEALGKNLNEVFNVIKEASGAPIEDPSDRVIEKNQIIELNEPINTHYQRTVKEYL